MDAILNYQASIFGNFSDIKFDQENLSKIQPIFSDYIVNAVPITAIDVRTNRLISDNRIQLISNDKQYYITFLPERIDFTYNLIKDNVINIDLDIVKNNIKEKVNKTLSEFSKLKINRLANSCNFLSRIYSKEEVIQEINKYSSPSSFYSTIENLCEWQIRLNNRDRKLINENLEDNNNIVNLSLSVESDTKYRIVGTMDINTNPRNEDLRFKIDDLLIYMDYATDKMKELISKSELH